jgi:hypothetical protein
MKVSDSVSLTTPRDMALSSALLNRSNSATPAVCSASIMLERFAQVVDARDAKSRSNSATPAVVILPIIR